MSDAVRCGARRLAGLVVLALVAGCGESAPTAMDGAPSRPEALQNTLASGNARVRVTVRTWQGGPAVGSFVTLVHRSGGPFRTATVPASGVVSFLNMPNNISFCAHARSGVAASTPGKTDLYPAAVGVALDEPTGDPGQAPVLTTAAAPGYGPVTVQSYVLNCTQSPPVSTPNGGAWVDVLLVHGQATQLDVSIADLVGTPRRDVQRGAVIPFACGDIPWIENCDPDVPPGFLQAHTAAPQALGVASGVPFRIESVDLVDVNGTTVELVATQGFDGTGSSGPLALPGEQLVCDASNFREDAVGDAAVLDIQGRVKFSIGVDYLQELEPDPTTAVVWFDMTPDAGTLRFSTRTVFAGQSATNSFNAEWSVSQAAEGNRCSPLTVWGSGVALGFEVEAYCASLADRTRVTLVQRGLFPPWSSHEFNVTTRGEPGSGSGDSTEDPARSGSSRAWISFVNSSVCTVPGGNDDRFEIRL